MPPQLPRKHVTLSEFCRQANILLNLEDVPGYVRFVLNGICDGFQYAVDPIQDRVDDWHDITALRDYDSLLAVHSDILFDADLTLSPNAPKYQTLSKDVYIKISFNQGGTPRTVPLHKIPNVCIGKWHIHNTLRVVITGLYSETRTSVQLDQHEMAEFCDKGFYPAVRELIGPDEWPPKYSSELFRETNNDSYPIKRTVIMSRVYTPHLANTIRRHLQTNNVSYADGILMYHQIQGVKTTTSHQIDRFAVDISLREFLASNGLDPHATDRGSWWIDVGFELSSSLEECLIWRTDAHASLLREVLSIAEHDAVRSTSMGSSEYVRDMASHIPTLSGCRIKPGKRSQGQMQARYFQLYMTDKSVTVRHNGQYHGNYITGKDILKGKHGAYLNGLYSTYLDASEHISAHARMEVRVPIAHAKDVFMDIDLRNLRQALVSYPKTVWWGFRAHRCLAFSYILMQQAEGPAHLRAGRTACLLTAAAPWFVNGLHCTPDNGPAARDLIEAVLPHTDAEGVDPNTLPFVRRRSRWTHSTDAEMDDEISSSEASDSDGELPAIGPVRNQTANTVPFIGNGILFFRPIRMGDGYPMARFEESGGRFIQDRTFRFIFGMEVDQMTFEFLSAAQNGALYPGRISNKTRTTPKYVSRGQDDEAPLFSLAQRGFHFSATPVDHGSDIDEDDGLAVLADQTVPTLLDIDSEITRLWRQALQDFITRSPNRKKSGEGSYCRLSEDDQRRVNEDTFRNLNLAVTWNDCQFKIASEKEWDDCFDRIFPERVTFQKKPQNYASLAYYRRWAVILQRVEEKCRNAIRKALRKRFNSLSWVPYARSDRLWWTKGDPKLTKLSGEKEGTAAPQLLVRGDAGVPTWGLDLEQ